MTEQVVCVGTGHRPPRLGLGYDSESNRRLTRFAEHELAAALLMHGVTEVVSGMAQGWDQALAHAAYLLGIDLVCALPFRDMGDNWPADARKRRDTILSKAKLVHCLYACGYKAAGNRSYIERDRWMVDRAGRRGGLLLALWDGGEQGGTWETVKYARQKGLLIRNSWQEWHEWCGVSSSVKPCSEEAPDDDSGTSGMGNAPR